MSSEPEKPENSGGLEALFNPESVLFVGGSNLEPALKYHKDQGFAGSTWVLNPRRDTVAGYSCYAKLRDLPHAPDLAFVAIRREAAVEVISALRDAGCKAVICNAAGFAEMGENGAEIDGAFRKAVGDMAVLGPNSIGLANFVDPMAAMMDHFGATRVNDGVAIVSQGGGFLCDMVFANRGLPITHLVGCGNQVVTDVAACTDYLLDDPRVKAVGIAFEGLSDVSGLRAAATKAARLGKPLVAFKLGRTEVGADAVASHTAAMAGAAAAWDAFFDAHAIAATKTEAEFMETLKLFYTGQVPKGRRALVTAASGVNCVMVADHMSEAGFEFPQPSEKTKEKLKTLLPDIATPANPQDVTMAAWNDLDRQEAVFATLMDEGYDIAVLVQNYPRDGMWDVAEYAAQTEALGRACGGRETAGILLAPLADCLPGIGHDHCRKIGLAPMQGQEEMVLALTHALNWHERAGALIDPDSPVTPRDTGPGSELLDEAQGKNLLQDAGIRVPQGVVAPLSDAVRQSASLVGPFAVKAMDVRLLHKTEAGAVRIGIENTEELALALTSMQADMAKRVPDIPLETVLIEEMVPPPVAEVMASVTWDASVGAVMMIAGGGVEAELWNDSVLVALPAGDDDISRALDRLKLSKKLAGWRGAPAGDRVGLIRALMALQALYAARAEIDMIEINPILVGTETVTAVDAVVRVIKAED